MSKRTEGDVKVLFPGDLPEGERNFLATMCMRLSRFGDSIVFHGDVSDPNWYVIRAKPGAVLDDLEPVERLGRARVEGWMKEKGTAWGYAILTDRTGTRRDEVEEPSEASGREFDVENPEDMEDAVNKLKEMAENLQEKMGSPPDFGIAIQGTDVPMNQQLSAKLMAFLLKAKEGGAVYPIITLEKATGRVYGVRAELIESTDGLPEDEKAVVGILTRLGESKRGD